MYSLAELAVRPHSALGASGGGRPRARRYELIHSATVTTPRHGLAAGTPAEFDCECLVSVLREEWVSAPHRARLRIMHTAPGLGPLESVVTGVSVPWIVRLTGGETSPFREVAPASIGLELRLVGRVEVARALREFELQPASSYTIVIAGCDEHAAQVVEWTPENAE